MTVAFGMPRSLNFKSPRLPKEGGSLCHGGGGGVIKGNNLRGNLCRCEGSSTQLGTST